MSTTPEQTTDGKRYVVWPLSDNSGEFEVLDISGAEPSTCFIGSKADAETEAAGLNELETSSSN